MIALPASGVGAASLEDAILNSVSVTTVALIVCVVVLVIALVFVIDPAKTSSTSSPARPVGVRLPGPRGLSATLSVLSMLKNAPRRMFNKSRTYGKLFGLGSGAGALCIVTDHDVLDDLFINKADTLSDRGGILINYLSSIPFRGSIGQNGAGWIENREFIAQTIKNADYGRDNIARCIEAAVPNLKAVIDEPVGDVEFDPRLTVQLYVMEILHRIFFGMDVDYDYGDKKVILFTDSVYDFSMTALNPTLSALAFPSIIDSGCSYRRYRSKVRIAADHVKTRSDETLLRHDDASASSSLIARFANYIEAIRASGKSTIAEPEDGWRLVFDFFFAAMGTVPEAILWAILFLATRQDVQRKMRTEIKQLVQTTDKDATYDDRDSLPYVMATMLEVLRMRSPAPMGVPHYVAEETIVGEYAIPKGAQILPNIWGMHNNPELWDNPEDFNPDRFLTDQGGLHQDKAKLVIPFSKGARSCPGEQIARMTIFHTLIALVTAYDITLPPKGPRPSLSDEVHSFVMVPDRYKVVFSPVASLASENMSVVSI